MLLHVLMLLSISGSQATHFHGTMMTYRPKEFDADGSVLVSVRCQQGYISCSSSDSWACSGNCLSGSVPFSLARTEEISGQWCQSEGAKTLSLPNNSPFQLVLSGGGWLINVGGVGNWRAVTDVELRTRSDTSKPNTSPQSTILPVLRVPSNCIRYIAMLAFDPDGDAVRCRYAKADLSECVVCTTPTVLSLSSSCSFVFSPTYNKTAETYVVQMVMEDFPTQTITLTQNNGSQVVRTNNDAISKIPLQFVLKVDPGVPSCTEGSYLPTFLPPTPENRAQFSTYVNKMLEIPIKAAATQSEMTELLLSGPHDVVKISSGTGDFTLRWTPSESESGGSHPICFIAQASVLDSVYQSELRCVIVAVEPEPIPFYVKVVKIMISSTFALKNNSETVSNLIKDDLNRRGMTITNVRILSSEAMKISN